MQQDNDNGNMPAAQVHIVDEQVPIRSQTGGASTRGNNWIDLIFKRHMVYDPLMILFSLFIIILGVVGYVSKGSVPSIVSSTVFFLVLLICTYVEGVRRNSYPLIVTLGFLFIFMAVRYSKTGQFWPNGLVSSVSFLLLIRHLYMAFILRNPE